MGLLVSADLVELTKVGLGEIYMNEYAAPGSQYSAVFNVSNSEKALEQELLMAGFSNVPQWDAEGQRLPIDKPISGSRIGYEHTDYGFQWVLSHKLLRDDLYKKTGKELSAAAGLATAHTIEATAANVLNKGFTAASAGGYDMWDGTGKTLFSATHVRLDGGSAANRPTTDGALTVGSFQAGLTAFMRAKNHRGQPLNIQAVELLVPPELMYIAKEILSNASLPYAWQAVTQVPGDTSSADYAPNLPTENVFRNTVSLRVWPYLTDANAWFLRAPTSATKLKFFWREKPNYDAWADPETKGVGNSVNFAFSVGATSYEGIYGNKGA